MRGSFSFLTSRELDVMRAVWSLHCNVTVRAVHQEMSRTRPIALTSVLTMMKILERKGHLKRMRNGRVSVYCPTLPRQESLRRMVAVFVDRVFDGSVEDLLNHLPERRNIA
jgi:predicted transcriptional regulator